MAAVIEATRCCHIDLPIKQLLLTGMSRRRALKRAHNEERSSLALLCVRSR
jgi:hypothetical protein